VQAAIDAWGKIDIVVKNAGYTIDAPIHKMSDEAFQRILDIHTIVPFRVIRAAAPHLREPAKREAVASPTGVEPLSSRHRSSPGAGRVS
jgi:3-oxoacyl-[acyl-carrier protein] reductase